MTSLGLPFLPGHKTRAKAIAEDLDRIDQMTPLEVDDVNYYDARQVKPDTDRPDAGKWRYTCMNDGRIWPVGYCAACPGHDTPEEARQHQTDYDLDQTRYDGKLADTQHRCKADGCEEWTDRFASVGPGQMAMYVLCDQHRNRETVAALYGTVGMSFGSY